MRAISTAFAAALLLAACAHPADNASRVPYAGDDTFPPQPSDLVPTRKLTPVIASGWTTKAQDDEDTWRRFHGMTPKSVVAAVAALNRQVLTMEAHFGSGGMTVTVDSSDLFYPSAHESLTSEDWALAGDGHHVLIVVEIYSRPESATFPAEPDALLTNCGPGVESDGNGNAKYRRLIFHPELDASPFQARASDFEDHSLALLVDGDPHRIAHCTLHLSRAIRLRNGEPVPDLDLKAIDGQHDTRTILMWNAPPPAYIAAR